MPDDAYPIYHVGSSSHGDTDPLAGLLNRDALLSMLFRETDRVQRMHTSLSVMLFEVNDFVDWRARLGLAASDDLLRHVAIHVLRLLRSYDSFGRVGNAAFVLVLPGCTPVNAISLAERIRAEVLCVPFQVGGAAARMTISFGIAPSLGRSPLVVLREAEQALHAAISSGPGAIRTSRDRPQPSPSPAEFLSGVASKDRRAR